MDDITLDITSVLYLGMLDPVVASGESQCSEEYFARSLQGIMGLTKCKQTAVKHPLWLPPGFLDTKRHAICSFVNVFACNLQE